MNGKWWVNKYFFLLKYLFLSQLNIYRPLVDSPKNDCSVCNSKSTNDKSLGWMFEPIIIWMSVFWRWNYTLPLKHTWVCSHTMLSHDFGSLGQRRKIACYGYFCNRRLNRDRIWMFRMKPWCCEWCLYSLSGGCRWVLSVCYDTSLQPFYSSLSWSSSSPLPPERASQSQDELHLLPSRRIHASLAKTNPQFPPNAPFPAMRLKIVYCCRLAVTWI